MPSTKKPQDHKAKTKKSYGAGWKQQLVDLDLPSGETCQVRRPGVQGLIKAGVLHSMDSLTSIVQSETIPKASGAPVISAQELIADPKKIDEMMEVADRIVAYVVVQPELVKPVVTEEMLDDPSLPFTADNVGDWLDYQYRDPNLVYLDYVDQTDKMFIMNFAMGGSADLQRFRKEAEALVGGVSAGEATPDPTE